MSITEADWLTQGVVFTREQLSRFDYPNPLNDNEGLNFRRMGKTFIRVNQVAVLVRHLRANQSHMTVGEILANERLGLGDLLNLPWETRQHVYGDFIESGDMNIVPRHDYPPAARSRRLPGGPHYKLAPPPALLQVSRQVFTESLLMFIEKATIIAPRLDQASIWSEVLNFLSQFPSSRGFNTVRHLRLDMDAIKTSGFLAQQMGPEQRFHHNLFPGLRKITLDIELEAALTPAGADDSDKEHDLLSEDSNDSEEEDADFDVSWQQFDQYYDLIARFQRPRRLRQVRLVVWADSASLEYSSIRVLFLGDQIARVILGLRQTSSRLSIEITVRNCIGVGQPALHVLMASMNRRLEKHRQQFGGSN